MNIKNFLAKTIRIKKELFHCSQISKFYVSNIKNLFYPSYDILLCVYVLSVYK